MRKELDSGKATTCAGYATGFLAALINLPVHRSDIAKT